MQGAYYKNNITNVPETCFIFNICAAGESWVHNNVCLKFGYNKINVWSHRMLRLIVKSLIMKAWGMNTVSTSSYEK